MALSAQENWKSQILKASIVAGLLVMLGGCAAPSTPPVNPQSQATQGIGGQADANPATPSASLNALQAWAESGDIGAQYDLGLTLADSDSKAAGRWFEGAALQGYGPAAYQMGLMQSEPKRAVEWYSMASAMDHIGAQYKLGDAYLNARGTAMEPEWGMMWFERAARAGSVDAQRALGVAMATGAAGTVQRREALMWLLIAARQTMDMGSDAAADMISALKARLNPAAIKLAEQQAEVWVKEASSTDVGDRATVRFTQYALNRLGYDAGYADGIDGERTYDAIVAFRVAEQMGGGGIDGALLDRLRERLSDLKRRN